MRVHSCVQRQFGRRILVLCIQAFLPFLRFPRAFEANYVDLDQSNIERNCEMGRAAQVI